jgi:hypothetical protein
MAMNPEAGVRIFAVSAVIFKALIGFIVAHLVHNIPLKGQRKWRGMLLVEHKSFGQNLGKAESQAFRYIQDLARTGRAEEIPRYVILSDFARIVLHDLEPEDQKDLPLFDQWHVRTLEFPLADFRNHVREFAFIKGEKPVRLDPEDPANFKAA